MRRGRAAPSLDDPSRPGTGTAFRVGLAIVTALVAGAGSAAYALRARDGSGTMTVGGWTSQAVSGPDEADPYARARAALDGLLPLGQAEGVAFAARRDSDGALLSMGCRYRLHGVVPPARLWTLSAAGTDAGAPRSTVATLTSHQVLYAGDGAVTIEIGPQASPGDWLKTGGDGAMVVALTLYDTPSVSRGGISQFVLPIIGKVGCDA